MSQSPIVMRHLMQLASAEMLPFEPFRPGVDIHRLYGDGKEGPSAALLRYAAGARVPMHVHTGYEHIYVLSGSQGDERGVYDAGTLVIHRPGQRHSVHSPQGCTVLAIWQRPVAFDEDGR
jgi:anti-sigma factor ChrR (cupin superfamily)